MLSRNKLFSSLVFKHVLPLLIINLFKFNVTFAMFIKRHFKCLS